VNGLSNALSLLRSAIKRYEAQKPAKAEGEGTQARESLLMASGPVRISESIRVLEAVKGDDPRERIFKVALISEGLGNKRNMNYYGPEAMTSGVKVYEGKWCFLDHASMSEERDLPERSVLKKAGFYQGLKVESIEGAPSIVGNLHCDFSESGKMLADKLDTALHYKKLFPSNGLEYCGLSVNGDGDSEKREMVIDGQTVEVNYVTQFTEGESTDLVTTPARGGRGLSVIKEDTSGAAAPIQQEVSMKKLLMKLRAVSAQFAEAAKKLNGDDAKLSEAIKKSLAECVREAEGESEAEAEAFGKMLDKREGEADDAYKSRLGGMAKALADKMGGGMHAEPDGDEPPAEAEAEAETGKGCESARKPLSKSNLERNRLAVKAVMAESKLPESAYEDAEIDRLARLPFEEAKAVIRKDARLVREACKAADIPVASLHRGSSDEPAKGRTEALKESFAKRRD
jgi:hypothetical protein